MTQALNYLGKQGYCSIFDFYERQAEEARLESAPAVKPKPRIWSEPIRIIAMGISADAPADELEAWINFLEGQGDTERANFAKEQRRTGEQAA